MVYNIEEAILTDIVKVIDKNSNGTISFEEFMNFVDLFIAYFDEKGERIIKPKELLAKIKDNN